jgi:hypothetical protein
VFGWHLRFELLQNFPRDRRQSRVAALRRFEERQVGLLAESEQPLAGVGPRVFVLVAESRDQVVDLLLGFLRQALGEFDPQHILGRNLQLAVRAVHFDEFVRQVQSQDAAVGEGDLHRPRLEGRAGLCVSPLVRFLGKQMEAGGKDGDAGQQHRSLAPTGSSESVHDGPRWR